MLPSPAATGAICCAANDAAAVADLAVGRTVDDGAVNKLDIGELACVPANDVGVKLLPANAPADAPD